MVCDPILAGVFVHEAFGHLSESDFVYENERMREIMVLGRKFGGKHLNIVDGAAVPGLRGSYKYDDEGVPRDQDLPHPRGHAGGPAALPGDGGQDGRDSPPAMPGPSTTASRPSCA